MKKRKSWIHWLTDQTGRKARYLADLPSYIYFHKFRFGITNTKNNITFTVFRESFLRDQYRIREFFDQAKPAGKVLFLDIGRNHGLVFFYLLDHIAQRSDVASIHYIGIDPSPLKFVYYNSRKLKFPVSYRIVDKAVVFDSSETVRLKYGERNFGNFNVSGSTHEKKLSPLRDSFEFIEIEVDTIRNDELMDLLRSNLEADTIVVKIDCKNRNEVLFLDSLDILRSHAGSHLVACERDGTAGRDMSEFRSHERRALASISVKEGQAR